MLKILSIIVTLLFIAVGILLGVLNPTPIELDLFLIKPVLPLSLILAVVLILGMVIGSLLISLKLVSFRWQLSKANRQSRKQADQIVQLKKQLAAQSSKDSSSEVQTQSHLLISKQ